MCTGLRNRILNFLPKGVRVSSLGSLCLRRSRLSWRSRAMIAAMEKSVAQGRAEHSSSMAGPRSRPSPCSSIKFTASEPSLPAPAPVPAPQTLSPSEHPIGTEHSLAKRNFDNVDVMVLTNDRAPGDIIRLIVYFLY